MKQKLVRISESMDKVLNELAIKTNMSHTEIMQRGILAMAVGNSIEVKEAIVESERSFSRRWSEEELEELKELRSSGVPGREIAEHFGRDYFSTMNKARSIGA